MIGMKFFIIRWNINFHCMNSRLFFVRAVNFDITHERQYSIYVFHLDVHFHFSRLCTLQFLFFSRTFIFMLYSNVNFPFAVSPVDVKITGASEAKAEQEVTTVCTTAKSNPPADIKWTVGGVNFNNGTQRTMPATNGGWITTSNVTFTINKEVRRVVVICHAMNARIGTTVTGTHIVNVICTYKNLVFVLSIFSGELFTELDFSVHHSLRHKKTKRMVYN